MREGRYDWPAPPSEDEVSWVSGRAESAGKARSVLNPIPGRGTVMYECGLRGLRCIGAEPDPFLRWISSVRSYMFRKDAAEKAGYAWERVSDDVFWESEVFVPAAVPGAVNPDGNALDFLGRVRYQIDRESEEGINNLLRLAVCAQIPSLRDIEQFDDMAGLTAVAGSLERIRQGIEPQPTVFQDQHLCDPRDLPYGIRNVYDAVISVLPPIGKPADMQELATMMSWIGFGDVERRDDMSLGYPYGGTEGLVQRNPVTVPDDIPSLDNDIERQYLAHWFFYVRSLALSVKGNMAKGCEASFLAPDEEYRGTVIRKAEMIADMLSSEGIECRKEGTGAQRCVIFSRDQ